MSENARETFFKNIGNDASSHKILANFSREAKKHGCTLRLIGGDFRTPNPNEKGEYKHCFFIHYYEDTGNIEYTTQLIGKDKTIRDYSKEPYVDFIVYGDGYEIPSENKAFFIVRMPNGKVPWSKKIAPAINKLINSWSKSKYKGWDTEMAIDHESAIYEGDPRLWDLKKKGTLRYQWLDNKLIEVKK